mgnify:FL=1
MMRACKVRRILLLMVLAFSMMLSGVSYAGVEPAGSGKADVLIAFDRQPGSEEAALVRAFGGSVSHVYQIVPAIAATVPQAALYGLSHNPRILRIDPDLTVQALGEEIPWGIARIGATEARTAGASGATIKVAVLDTGIDFSHEDLTGHTSAGYDFVNEDGNPMDDDGHGTHVAGTIAATVGNDTGVVGVAPNVKLYALKVLDSNGSGSFSDIIEALQWCVTNGIDVTNNSYGSSGDPGPTVQEAFNNAYAADMLHVAAAGNSGKVRGTGDTVG